MHCDIINDSGGVDKYFTRIYTDSGRGAMMVRVISGTAGGLKLHTLDSDATRPTLDRVKEAMFSMIQDSIYGARTLDLFAV